MSEEDNNNNSNLIIEDEDDDFNNSFNDALEEQNKISEDIVPKIKKEKDQRKAFDSADHFANKQKTN